MSRSHPPTLITSLRRTLREECGVTRGAHLLLAVSGGSDSTALLHAMARLAPSLGLRLAAHGVDHGLRAEAALELDAAAELAAEWRVPFSRSIVSVSRRGNLQAAAREARYAALRDVMKQVGASAIVTAHHADDRAETILMRLLRGAGPRGVCVLPARSGDLVRPLIRVRKADVLAHLERHQLRYARDPSNLDSRFQRTRLRCEVLPLLESIAPGAVDHLNLFADALAAGPPPTVLDALGNAVPLGRAQVAAVRRAQLQQPGKPGRSRIRLSGGRELAIDAKTRTYEVVEPASEKGDAD